MTNRTKNPNSKWSAELRSDHNDVPADIRKFHMHLVMLDYSPQDISVMIDTIQEDLNAWATDGCPAFSNAGHVESFFSERSARDEDLGEISVAPKARRRHVLRRRARDVFGRLAALSSSVWPFTQALSTYSHELERLWPEPGEPGYFACLEASASSYRRLRAGVSQHWHGDGGPSEEALQDAKTRRERRDTMNLLRMKLAIASRTEADLLDVPVELVLHCATVDDFGNQVFEALRSLYGTWVEFSRPELNASDQVASLIAYWLKRRWETVGRRPDGAIPYGIAADITSIRTFCDWTSMPRLSAFARVFEFCNGDYVLPEDVIEDADDLNGYLDDTEIWFRLHVAGDIEF